MEQLECHKMAHLSRKRYMQWYSTFDSINHYPVNIRELLLARKIMNSEPRLSSCLAAVTMSATEHPFLWYRGFYDTAVFILSVPMQCSATRRFFYLYIHKHNSHIYRNVWSFCPNVLNFCKYTHFYLFLRNSRHFYFTLIPCFVKCPIIKP
jgi:hypothetical protein